MWFNDIQYVVAMLVLMAITLEFAYYTFRFSENISVLSIIYRSIIIFTLSLIPLTAVVESPGHFFTLPMFISFIMSYTFYMFGLVSWLRSRLLEELNIRDLHPSVRELMERYMKD